VGWSCFTLTLRRPHLCRLNRRSLRQASRHTSEYTRIIQTHNLDNIFQILKKRRGYVADHYEDISSGQDGPISHRIFLLGRIPPRCWTPLLVLKIFSTDPTLWLKGLTLNLEDYLKSPTVRKSAEIGGNLRFPFEGSGIVIAPFCNGVAFSRRTAAEFLIDPKRQRSLLIWAGHGLKTDVTSAKARCAVIKDSGVIDFTSGLKWLAVY